MMVAHTIVETLIDLATIESDAAAKRLGNALRTSEESQEKKELLENYRQEYIKQLQTTMATGLSIQKHKNYQNFIHGLDRAINQQAQICLSDQDKVQEHRKIWQYSEKTRLSYTALSNRAISFAKKNNDKQEQRNTDEFACRKNIMK